MTSLATVAIAKLMEQDEDAAKAEERFLERIRNAPDRGTHGRITWTRDELYER
jgi:hypothetical protein